LEALDLTDLAERKVNALSGGQRRRLDVAMGLVHAPSLLFLDEPTTGLDPQNRANLWAHVDRMRQERGMTIVLTTHYLDEADSMTERVVIVDHGEVIADDTAEALKAKLAGDRIVATTTRSEGAALAALAEKLPGARDTVLTTGPRESTVEVRVDDAPASLPELIVAAHEAGVGIRGVQGFRPTLDDVFLNLTGRSLRENDTNTTTDNEKENAA
jgi:ABC-2 type transport system ATP-binding protein